MVTLWTGFVVFVLLLLAFDLGVLNRKTHAVSMKEALWWTAMWVSIALAFNVGIYFIYESNWFGVLDAAKAKASASESAAIRLFPQTGFTAATMFFMGYVVEQSLSLDNMLVIAVIIRYFRVPSAYQHRLLFWGILATIILRGIMIILGAALLERFEWMIYIFGGILIYSAYKMLRMGDDEFNVESSLGVRICRLFFRLSPEFDGANFRTKVPAIPVPHEGVGAGTMVHALTPMALALIVINFADVVFAVDSIPAIFGITRDSFLVFSSNIFAVLGLRAMYFVLAGMIDRFHHLKTALVLVLFFIGAKMIAESWIHIGHVVSLIIVLGTLAMGVVASFVFKPKDTHHASAGGEHSEH